MRYNCICDTVQLKGTKGVNIKKGKNQESTIINGFIKKLSYFY